jgi:hypothetical protein
MFSGVAVPEVANRGGSCAAAYRVTSLSRLDVGLLRATELIVVAPDVSWGRLLSHETGSTFHEKLYGCLGTAA